MGCTPLLCGFGHLASFEFHGLLYTTKTNSVGTAWSSDSVVQTLLAGLATVSRSAATMRIETPTVANVSAWTSSKLHRLCIAKRLVGQCIAICGEATKIAIFCNQLRGGNVATTCTTGSAWTSTSEGQMRWFAALATSR